MLMTHVNRVLNIEVSSATSNGSINTGNVVAKGFSANIQSVGGQSVIGTAVLRPNNSSQFNLVADPTAVDQGQTQV